MTATAVSFFLNNLFSQQLKPLNILEIGAGVGSLSQQFLPLLDKLKIKKEYHYTDISNAFLAYGHEQFKQYAGFLKFCKFNINQAPILQGLSQNYFDVIVADNVIHNAININTILTYANSLLKTGGIVVLNEAITKNDYATLIYGLTSGWWAFADPQRRIPNTPLINLTQWQELFTTKSFHFLSLNQLFNADARMKQDVIIALKA